MFLGSCYRSPSGDCETLGSLLQHSIIEKSVLEKKISYILVDFNMNCFSYHDKTKHFYRNTASFKEKLFLFH